MIDPSSYATPDPNNTWGSDYFPWAQGNVNNLPFSDVFTYPGGSVLTLLNRYMDNLGMPGFSGSLNLVKEFLFHIIGSLSSNGTLGQHGLAQILCNAGVPGGRSLAQELALVMGLETYKNQGSISQGDISSWIAQFPGSDPFSEALRNAFSSLPGVNWSNFSGQSVAMEWGNWVGQGGLEGIVPSLRKLSLKLLEDNNKGTSSTNVLYLYVLFYCMEASADQQDGMVAQGHNMAYITAESKATRSLANEAEDNSVSGKTFFQNLDKYLSDLQGSPLGVAYAASIESDVQTFKGITFKGVGNLWDFYQQHKDIPGTNWTDFNNAWKNAMKIPDPTGGGTSGSSVPSDYSKTQSSLSAMLSIWSDSSQVQTTQMQTMNSKSTNLQNTITEIINSLLKQLANTVQDQKTN